MQMKILVYGAGVLGSYLAHVLHRGGNDVTLLARGSRLEELGKNGLVIRHYLQFHTTVDQVGLTDHLGKGDDYDIVFVVMQRQQLDGILPQLCENESCGLFVLVGNNATAEETRRTIEERSGMPKRVIFAFQSTGGRRENGRVVSIHFAAPKLESSMTAGSLGGDDSWRPTLEQAFAKTSYRLRISENMDAWLKCHAAFVLPICFACYAAGGDLRKIAGNRYFLDRTIDAVQEGYRVVEACGYPVEPKEDEDFVTNHRLKCRLMLRLMAATPVGRLAASDHAMAAKSEMRRLYDDFRSLKRRAGIDTPAWDELSRYMI
ncbi:ketopantoate reductase family protein [Caproiciproducens sp. NJN-50]|nr:ketopantoate reductase family protein [Caproiciproducens sp. NJN-50]